MRAVQIKQAGGPEQLKIIDVELPPPSEGEVRVRVEFAGINFWDIMQRRGDVPLPHGGVPGSEGSGRVIAVGRGVDSLAIGDKVAWSKVHGSYADEVQAGAEWFATVPAATPMDQAAAILAQGTTAWYLAEQAAPLAPGSTAAVFAAAGGVGLLLTQLLDARGVRVIAVVGSEAKRQFLNLSRSTDVLVDSTTLVEDVRRSLPDGVDAVFDANGGADALRDLAMLAVRGRVVYYGTANGPLPDLDIGSLAAGSLTVSRVRGQDFLGSAAQWRTAAVRMLDAVATRTVVAHIDRIELLERVASQHEYMESRASVGKLLLAMAPD